ncbi:MAG TPA: ATP-binding protein [Corynebacterium sp.]|nr:ATP-binding protein [Corynebacterium sp.]
MSSDSSFAALRRKLPTSLRWRIVFWITAVVATALLSVVFITRSVLIAQVAEDSNSDVAQELQEFQLFAQEGRDPNTGLHYSDPYALINSFMTRQIPDDEEIFIGLVGDTVLQHDFTSIDNTHIDPLAEHDPLLDVIFATQQPSGIYDHPERGRVHWGRIIVEGGEEPAAFAVANFSQADREQAEQQSRMLAIFATAGLLASVLIAWLISGQIIAPIRQLEEVAAQINNSDLSRRVPVEGDDEVARLATTFNAMLDRIEAAYRDQRQFLDDAGHELRTPITVVRGQLELLEFSPPEERARSIELATAELDRMARMVNDMLTLAVADSGDFVHPAEVDVTELSIDIEDKAATISERGRLVQVAEGTVPLDEQRVTEAVLELYGNALRYSEGPVEIGTEFQGSGPARVLRIWVRDQGQGVPEEQLTQVFSRFSRGEQAKTSRPGGAGLGLSIVKAIAEAHGGRPYVESIVGLGSVFGVELPAPEPSAVPGPEGRDRPEGADSAGSPGRNL